MLKTWKESWRKDDALNLKSHSANMKHDMDIDIRIINSESSSLHSGSDGNPSGDKHFSHADCLSPPPIDRDLKREIFPEDHKEQLEKERLGKDAILPQSIAPKDFGRIDGVISPPSKKVTALLDTIFEHAKRENGRY